MVEQEENRVSGIEQSFAAAGRVFDPVVNGVYAIGYEEVLFSIDHTFPFLFCVLLRFVLVSVSVSDAGKRVSASRLPDEYEQAGGPKGSGLFNLDVSLGGFKFSLSRHQLCFEQLE
jgi:hypothetical protein